MLNGSDVAHNDEEILDALFDSVLAVLDSTTEFDAEHKTRALYFSCNLCSCNACKKESGAHINKKCQIRISKKFFRSVLNQKTPPPIGLVQLMYTIFHQVIRSILPEDSEETIIEKTEQAWKNGVSKLAKGELNCNT